MVAVKWTNRLYTRKSKIARSSRGSGPLLVHYGTTTFNSSIIARAGGGKPGKRRRGRAWPASLQWQVPCATKKRPNNDSKIVEKHRISVPVYCISKRGGVTQKIAQEKGFFMTTCEDIPRPYRQKGRHGGRVRRKRGVPLGKWQVFSQTRRSPIRREALLHKKGRKNLTPRPRA